MMTKILAKAYLWFLLALLYSPILIIMIFLVYRGQGVGQLDRFLYQAL